MLYYITHTCSNQRLTVGGSSDILRTQRDQNQSFITVSLINEDVAEPALLVFLLRLHLDNFSTGKDQNIVSCPDPAGGAWTILFSTTKKKNTPIYKSCKTTMMSLFDNSFFHQQSFGPDRSGFSNTQRQKEPRGQRQPRTTPWFPGTESLRATARRSSKKPTRSKRANGRSRRKVLLVSGRPGPRFVGTT